MNRYIVAFAGFMILVIALLIIIFSGGGKKPTAPTAPVKTLPEYASTNAATIMTIDGNVNGEDIHRAIRISIDRYQRKLDILSGYNYNVIQSNNFANNQAAYDVFLRSINGLGFTVKNPKYKIAEDRGKCPLGFRYIFELNDSGDEISRLWSSTCSGVGTLGGNSAQLQTLFKAQITGYSQLTNQVNLQAR